MSTRARPRRGLGQEAGVHLSLHGCTSAFRWGTGARTPTPRLHPLLSAGPETRDAPTSSRGHMALNWAFVCSISLHKHAGFLLLHSLLVCYLFLEIHLFQLSSQTYWNEITSSVSEGCVVGPPLHPAFGLCNLSLVRHRISHCKEQTCRWVGPRLSSLINSCSHLSYFLPSFWGFYEQKYLSGCLSH